MTSTGDPAASRPRHMRLPGPKMLIEIEGVASLAK
jgi:hypothetical protein